MRAYRKCDRPFKKWFENLDFKIYNRETIYR